MNFNDDFNEKLIKVTSKEILYYSDSYFRDLNYLNSNDG